jgi:glucokinase
MSVFKSQYTRALKVIPSDNANIPYPNLMTSGITTGAGTNQLIDSEANFISLGVAAGDIVYNNSNDFAATVVEVVSAKELLLNADVIPSSATLYSIYNASSQTSNGNPGCYLYIGADGNIEVTTIGGDRVTFNDLKGGTTLPVQVVKVHSYESQTTSTSIIALW